MIYSTDTPFWSETLDKHWSLQSFKLNNWNKHFFTFATKGHQRRWEIRGNQNETGVLYCSTNVLPCFCIFFVLVFLDSVQQAFLVNLMFHPNTESWVHTTHTHTRSEITREKEHWCKHIVHLSPSNTHRHTGFILIIFQFMFDKGKHDKNCHSNFVISRP